MWNLKDKTKPNPDSKDKTKPTQIGGCQGGRDMEGWGPGIKYKLPFIK